MSETPVDLLREISNSGLATGVKIQLKKDFNRAGIPLMGSENESEAMPVDQLWDLLKEKVYFLLMEDFEGLLNVLYAVDLPQQKLSMVKDEDPVGAAESISTLILKRTFKKLKWRSLG